VTAASDACPICHQPRSKDKRAKTCGKKSCGYEYRSRNAGPPIVRQPATNRATRPLIAPPGVSCCDAGTCLTQCRDCRAVKGYCSQCADATHQPPPKPTPQPKEKKQAAEHRTHLIIPDCQIHSDAPIEHLEWVGKYVADKRPDVIVCIGDFADMRALSSYDRGKKKSEGHRYVDDIDAARRGMELLTSQWRSIPDYRPRMVLTLGNHEDRIDRATNDFAALDQAIGLHDLAYEHYGWEVYPFLVPVAIDGVEYCHYFTSGVMGRPVTSAAALLRERAGSAVMGHVQHTDVAFHKKTQKIAIFAGTCYLHDEEYLTPQGNVQRRQIVLLHEVEDGRCDPMFVSLDFLRRKYSLTGA
jgi:hypothetical protein